MTFNEYQKEVWDLALPQCKNPTYMALGLGEAGEVQGKIKKVLRGDTMHMTANEVSAYHLKIKAELGDLQYYLAGLAACYGYTLEEIAIANIDKLHDRRERGVLQGDGDNR